MLYVGRGKGLLSVRPTAPWQMIGSTGPFKTQIFQVPSPAPSVSGSLQEEKLIFQRSGAMLGEGFGWSVDVRRRVWMVDFSMPGRPFRFASCAASRCRELGTRNSAGPARVRLDVRRYDMACSLLVFVWLGLPVVPFYPFLGEGSPIF